MKTIRLLTNIFYWLLAVVVVVFAIGLILTKQDNRWGIRAFHVDSGSMTPALQVGSLVVVQKQDRYSAGDVITFRMEHNQESFVTHRIVSVESDADIGKLRFTMKGDANKTPDPEPVEVSRVVGRVIWHLPLLGIPMGFARTQVGFVFLIVVPATILIYSELLNIKHEIVTMWRNRKPVVVEEIVPVVEPIKASVIKKKSRKKVKKRASTKTN